MRPVLNTLPDFPPGFRRAKTHPVPRQITPDHTALNRSVQVIPVDGNRISCPQLVYHWVPSAGNEV